MRVWDSMCATLVSSAYRRGAMMATLRCDHPDIEQFIDAKRDPRELRNFNLSVLISDDFMQAVQDDLPWPLVFPASAFGDPPRSAGREVIQRRWSGSMEAVPCVVVRKVGQESRRAPVVAAHHARHLRYGRTRGAFRRPYQPAK
jgi:ribonucleoside-diphosphate reductase alpha chain